MNIGLALVFGVLYWLATNKLWYGTLHLVRQPLVLAVPIGLIMGNLGDAMKIGASLQMIYLGQPGGTLPADEALVIHTISREKRSRIRSRYHVIHVNRRISESLIIKQLIIPHHSDKAAEKGDMKAMGRAEFWYPFFCSIPLRVLPTTLALLFGTDAVSAFLNAIPAWAMNGLSVAGGLLPALGFAVTIMVIGKKELIPYFILGFAMYAYTGMNTIGIAVIAICIAILQSQFTNSTGSTVAVDDDEGDF